MLERESLRRAIDLQERSYALLAWMSDGIRRGFILFDTAHTYATLPEAAHAWLERHYNDIPAAARPQKPDLRDFCNLFSTYLETSFVLVRAPGQRLYSPDAHCFCPMCSWLVDVPHLQPRKPTRSDKKQARSLEIDLVRALAAEVEVELAEGAAERAVDEGRPLREDLARVAWARALHRRLEGYSDGPVVLQLWRGFAWTEEGSPRKEVDLSVERFLEAEARIVRWIAG